MESKHVVTAGIVVLILIGLLWLMSLLPGLGFGLGGGKGGGAGNGNGAGESESKKAATVQSLLPPPGTKGVVILSKEGAELQGDGASVKVTAEKLEELANKDGREFEVKRKKDVPDALVRRFKQAEIATHGKVQISKEFLKD
jgi:hypothetical protein